MYLSCDYWAHRNGLVQLPRHANLRVCPGLSCVAGPALAQQVGVPLDLRQSGYDKRFEMPASGPKTRAGSVASTSRKHTRSNRDEPSGVTEYYDLTEDGDEQSQPAPTQSQAGQPVNKRAR